MAVAEEEAAQLFDRLRRVIESAGLTWVVQDVQHKIAEGKYYEKALTEGAQAPLPGMAKLPAQGSREFGTSARYTEAERLHLLLDAVEEAVVQGLELQDAVTEKLGTQIRFATEPVEDRNGFAVDRADVKEKQFQLEKFNSAIQRFRNLVDR